MSQPRFDQPSATCSEMIGREPALDVLERAIEAARAGRGTTLLVSGEAGIGKSRLARECAARFRAANASGLALRGHAFEGDQALPFAPISDLLRQLVLSLEPVRIAELFGPESAELVKLAPELAGVVTGIRASPTLDPEPEQRRLIEAFARFVARLVSGGPLLAIVEDLHWSDDASLELLLHLARRCAGQPVLLLLTFRDDEAGPALRHLLAGLDRERLATEARLTRLTVSDVDRMLRSIMGEQRSIRPDFLRSINDLTGGNPFFVEEVLKALTDAGDALYHYGVWDRRDVAELRIPRSVSDAVQRRVARLSAPSSEALSLAAVSGQRFSFNVLRELTGWDEARLLGSLKELIAAHLIVEESADVFAFRHALTREAVYSGLLARERRQLHRQIAGAMEQTDERGDSVVAELAYHYSAGEVWDEALVYARRAAERAMSIYAPRAAAEQLTRAIHAVRQLGAAQRADLFLMRAAAWNILGELEHSREDFEAAHEAAQQAGDAGGVCDALLGLGQLWSASDYTRAGDAYRQALELARRCADEARTARSLNWLGNWHANSERPREGLPLHREALAILERLGDRAGVATTLDLLATSSEHGGLPVDAARHFERAAALYRELGDRAGLASCLPTLSILRFPTWFHDMPIGESDRVAATRDGDEALALAREIGWRAGESYALASLAIRNAAAGELAAAADAANEALTIAEEIDHPQWRLVGHFSLALIDHFLLDYAHANEHVGQALALAKTVESTYWVRLLTSVRASLALDTGAVEHARELLNEARGAAQSPTTQALQHVWRERARLALVDGTPEQALLLIDELVATEQQASALNVPLLAYLRGRALAAIGRNNEAAIALRAACDGAAAQELPSLRWPAHIALGALLTRQGMRAAGRQELQAAGQLVEELTRRAPAGAAQQFRERARATFPSHLRIDDPDALTARERDVAAQVALGQTNREIADALYLSERTVETHVRNILGKLEFTSRAQIAVWVVGRRQQSTDP